MLSRPPFHQQPRPVGCPIDSNVDQVFSGWSLAWERQCIVVRNRLPDLPERSWIPPPPRLVIPLSDDLTCPLKDMDKNSIVLSVMAARARQ